ncbi:hypothetical protein [Ottowia thiooxydans]|uniref:hypothetical protein n=1 Tax=Ottowia thiooxydans TaxID=219182 RepID=UPI000686DD3C|nr:hypothetical protein [Ottowia thiooxydans]
MKIFQIFYDDVTRGMLDPSFTPLDNTASSRPDWFEYWPIRQTLLNNTFDDEEYLGFFSPRFKEKTRVSGNEVLAVMNRSTSEVVNFSPFLDHSALFLNSFYHAERVHPGCLNVSQEYLDKAGIPIQLRQLVQDQTRTIFSNFFVAKYRFWKKWMLLADQLFQTCEEQDSALAEKLKANTQHRDTASYPMKIFIMERMVSLALELEGLDTETAVDHAKTSPYGTGHIFNSLLALDALKGQFVKTKVGYFLGMYLNMRKEVMGSVASTR